MVQFYPWFKFYFLLFLGMVMYDNEFETKEYKFKPRIKLNHNIMIYSTVFCFCFSMSFITLEKAVIAKSSLLIDVKPWDDETGTECKNQ